MAVSQTNHVQQRVIEKLPTDSENHGKNPSGAALHQVFKNDCVGEKAKISPALVLEEKAPSFWSRIYAWFYPVDLDEQDSLASTPQAEALRHNEPVDLLPVLDIPESMPSDLEAAKLPPAAKSRNTRQTLTPRQLMEEVSLMSQHTIDEIMSIVMKGQIELEKENAEVAENTFTKYQNIKKLRERILEEIKDVLAKDQKFLDRCKTAQNIALVASFFSGLVATAVSFGLAGPLGPIALLATYGPVITAGLTGLTTGAKAYSQRRLDEDKAQHEQFNHQDKYTSDRIEDARERLMSTAEADQVYKERLIQMLKRWTKMNQLVMQK